MRRIVYLRLKYPQFGSIINDELNATNAALEVTEEKPAEVSKEGGDSRFVKLINVDNEYSDKITSIIMKNRIC